METLARIVNIQRFSIHDGPGIRTTVFFKGCPLACSWCHNPESISPGIQIAYEEKRCVHCGLCVEACHVHLHFMKEGHHYLRHQGCTGCGECIRCCMSEALSLKGSLMSIEAILDELEKDMDYYKNSGGGVTFSGGEPFMQPEVLERLIDECHALGLNVYIDTSGFCESAVFEAIAPKADGLLYDLKLMDPALHETFTGLPNDRILKNFLFCMKQGLQLRVRQVIVPGITDTQENLGRLIDFLKMAGYSNPVDLMIYHRMGAHKYKMLGIPYLLDQLTPPDEQQIERIVSRFTQAHVAVTVNR